MSAAMAAAAVFIASSAVGSGYSMYPQGRAALAVREDYTEPLRELNGQIELALEYYTPNADAEEAEKQSEQSSEAEHSAEPEHGDTPAQEAGSPAEPQSGESAGGEESSDGQEDNSAEPKEEQPAEEPEPHTTAEDFAKLYGDRLALMNEFDSAIYAVEKTVAEKLMDYDLLMKKLSVLLENYNDLKNAAEELSDSYRFGECELSELENAEKAVSDAYFEVEALLFDVSALKTEIEGITGQTLPSDFNFNSLYLITDGLEMDGGMLSYTEAAGSLCIPSGYEPEAVEAADYSAALNDAVKSYYDLGSALRSYIDICKQLKRTEGEYRLGKKTAEDVAALKAEKTGAFLAAYEAKIAYSKKLLALDEQCFGVLTAGYSAEAVTVFREALTEKGSGRGLWLVKNTNSAIVWLPLALPAGVYVDDEDISCTCTISYNGTRLAKAATGAGIAIAPIEYADGCNYAVVTFYQNNAAVGSYRIDVFSPLGGFISD